jgi:hypothetical protein
MSALRRYGSPRRLQEMLGLVLMGLVFAPSASGAAQLDTVTASGGSGITAINVSAQSGTSGENPSGQVLWHSGGGLAPTITGPVTCLNVTGNTAVLNFQATEVDGGGSFPVGIGTLELVANGGPGRDTFGFSVGARSPSDCSPLTVPAFAGTFSSGGVVIFDAPPLPISKAQCKNGGWRNFPQFKNQGQCVAFVVKQARQSCLAERAKIGLLAFRNKYGLGRYHVRALSRCVNRASR